MNSALLFCRRQFQPAVYQSSATLLSSLFFPPYEQVSCNLEDEEDEEDNNDEDDDDDDQDDCQITGEYINEELPIEDLEMLPEAMSEEQPEAEETKTEEEDEEET